MIDRKVCNGRFHLKAIHLALGLALLLGSGCSQSPSSGAAGTVPTFTRSFTVGGQQYHYTAVGADPKQGGTTTIPTVLVPVSLTFEASADKREKKLEFSAVTDVRKVVHSPIFQNYPFATGNTQYGDAVQRAAFYKQAASNHWHVRLGQPRVTSPLEINIPKTRGYLLTSKRTGHSLGVVDLNFVQKELFKGLSKKQVKPGQLVIALTKDADFYQLGDATVCCTRGSHGVHVDPATKARQEFVLSTYLDPGVLPGYSDIQGLSQQIAAWMNDPLHGVQSNEFPPWHRPGQYKVCAGGGFGTRYRFALPTDGSSTIANSTVVKADGNEYHLENAALLPWYMRNPHPDSYQGAYSFPGLEALRAVSQPCVSRLKLHSTTPTGTPRPNPRPNGHELIGYWGSHVRGKSLRLQDVPPQWGIILVAFASPGKGSEDTVHFRTPAGYTVAQFRAAIREMQRRGKKILISLGGGGQVVNLNTPEELHNFVGSVSSIVKEYGFNGVDLDFETPSLVMNPGDTDFRKPTTPSVVNLIGAMKQLRRRFGPKFMISVVPEGPQVPAGFVTYGGQFGSFLPVIYGIRKIMAFVDVQNYNTPPLEGLDGNYYMPGTADYYAAMTELLLHGFNVGGNPKEFFPPLPPQKVAIGFLVARSPLPAIENSLRYLAEGKPYAGGEYKLMQRGGYRNFNGAMFWTIQADWRENYRFSNVVGPLLHSFPPVRAQR